MALQTDVSLKPFNTFGVEVQAHYLFVLNSLADLAAITQFPKPHLLIGGGSNLLLTKDYPGTVIINRLQGIKVLDETADHIWVEVASGENWHGFVCHAIAQGWYGLEYLALIPGTVGAAPVQNIGAYGAEVGALIERVITYCPQVTQIEELSAAACCFGYRDSVFKHTKAAHIITAVIFKLHKKPVEKPLYAALDAWFAIHKHPISPETIFAAVVAIRQEKLPDIHEIGSAGSFFKNPIVEKKLFEKLKHTYPDLIGYPTQTPNQLKLAAGQLIDLLGVKGQYCNNVGMYEKQALVLVNLGGATGLELATYAQTIQAAIHATFSVVLEPEPLII